VPAAYVPLARIPLTPNGKLDKAALPAPGPDAYAQADYVPPRSRTEHLLAGIWSRILGVERVGVYDRFSDLGGHSILIIQVINAAKEAGVPLSLWMLYRHETVAEVAELIDAEADAESTDGAAHADRSLRPVSAQQPAVLPSPLPVMAERNVPGVSVAVISGGELTGTLCYGVLAAGQPAPVTAGTLFQAGSASKYVTAVAALRLVRDGRLHLDDDIRGHLTSWRYPDHDGRPVTITLRQLLSHTSGLDQVRKLGFGRNEPLPTVPDLLRGRPPAPHPAPQLTAAPGSAFHVADVNFTVIQQLLTELTGQAFPELMRALVFDPLGMTGSSFDPSFPETSGRPVALGHDQDGSPVEGGWQVRPDLAAAGLWITAADLARVTLDIRRAYFGGPAVLLDQDLARQMLTVGYPGSFYGLGSIVDDTNELDTGFGHGGEVAGYRAMAISRLHSGFGVVVLTNGEGGKDVIALLAAHIGHP